MRQDPIGHLLVVLSQFKFGDSLIGIENAVRMGKLDAGDFRIGSGTRWGRFFLLTHVLSRVTWAAGLSSRNPWKEGWRSRLSAVHSVNATAPTSFGSTQ